MTKNLRLNTCQIGRFSVGRVCHLSLSLLSLSLFSLSLSLSLSLSFSLSLSCEILSRTKACHSTNQTTHKSKVDQSNSMHSMPHACCACGAPGPSIDEKKNIYIYMRKSSCAACYALKRRVDELTELPGNLNHLNQLNHLNN